jgi:ABC-type cobalamin transport system ATPase subunit
MSAPEGWAGTSIKDHVESAKLTAYSAELTAGEALELARENTDDLATLKAELAELRLALGLGVTEASDHD